MGWRKALLHAAIAAGSAFSGAFLNAVVDGMISSSNLLMMLGVTVAALFASLSASYMAGEFSDVEPAPSAPGSGGA